MQLQTIRFNAADGETADQFTLIPLSAETHRRLQPANPILVDTNQTIAELSERFGYTITKM